MAATKILQVKVKPGARDSTLTPAADGTWLAQIKSPPVDGKANAELIALVASLNVAAVWLRGRLRKRFRVGQF